MSHNRGEEENSEESFSDFIRANEKKNLDDQTGCRTQPSSVKSAVSPSLLFHLKHEKRGKEIGSC